MSTTKQRPGFGEWSRAIAEPYLREWDAPGGDGFRWLGAMSFASRVALLGRAGARPATIRLLEASWEAWKKAQA